MKQIEYLRLVDELNEELPQDFKDKEIAFYEYSTNGYVDLITFADFSMYCPEHHSIAADAEEAGEDVYQAVKKFIIQQRNTFILELYSLLKA